MSRLQAESMLANDQVRRLTDQVGELDGHLRLSQELIDKQAAEVLLQTQGRKALEEARKTKESVLSSAEAHIKELEASPSSSKDKLHKEELEIKKAQDIIANHNTAMKEVGATVEVKELAL